MYDQAKREKLKELKRLMYELMSDEGADVELSKDELEGKLEEADEASSALDVEAMEEETDEEPLEEEVSIEVSKTPKRRPGTAVVFAKPDTPKPAFMDVPSQPKSKKSRYA